MATDTEPGRGPAGVSLSFCWRERKLFKNSRETLFLFTLLCLVSTSTPLNLWYIRFYWKRLRFPKSEGVTWIRELVTSGSEAKRRWPLPKSGRGRDVRSPPPTVGLHISSGKAHRVFCYLQKFVCQNLLFCRVCAKDAGNQDRNQRLRPHRKARAQGSHWEGSCCKLRQIYCVSIIEQYQVYV